MCPWYLSCKKWCVDHEDMTLQFKLGRARRDTLKEDLEIETLADLEHIDIPALLKRRSKDKNFLKRIVLLNWVFLSGELKSNNVPI